MTARSTATQLSWGLAVLIERDDGMSSEDPWNDDADDPSRQRSNGHDEVEGNK